MPYYAVKKGHQVGIYNTWTECQQQVKGFRGAIFKKFKTLEEAKEFIGLESTSKIKKEDNKKYDYIVFTDGSCLNNGRKNPIAGYGIYFQKARKLKSLPHIARKLNLGDDISDSNNRAELYAIIKTVKLLKSQLKKGRKVLIRSDSQYSIKAYTIWCKKWKKNNWKKNDGKDVKNLDLIKKGCRYFEKYDTLEIQHIYAHTNQQDDASQANANADKLAYLGAIFNKKVNIPNAIKISESEFNKIRKEIQAESNIKKQYKIAVKHGLLLPKDD